jgi:hypothetical protein
MVDRKGVHGIRIKKKRNDKRKVKRKDTRATRLEDNYSNHSLARRHKYLLVFLNSYR